MFRPDNGSLAFYKKENKIARSSNLQHKFSKLKKKVEFRSNIDSKHDRGIKKLDQKVVFSVSPGRVREKSIFLN